MKPMKRIVGAFSLGVVTLMAGMLATTTIIATLGPTVGALLGAANADYVWLGIGVASVLAVLSVNDTLGDQTEFVWLWPVVAASAAAAYSMAMGEDPLSPAVGMTGGVAFIVVVLLRLR